MSYYTDAELADLVRDSESQLVERKRSGSDRSGIRRNICAFANDLAGRGKPGAIFIGLEDSGACANLPIDDELLRTLAQMRSDGNILPLPSVDVQRKVLDGCAVAVVQVLPADNPPLRYQGRVWVKVGPTVQAATPEEEQRLVERRRAADLPFDMRPCGGATESDLDLEYVRRTYVPAAVSPEILEQNRRPLPHQLRALRLVANEHPTWGALIACGIDPQAWAPGAYVQFLRIDGIALADPIKDQKALTGKLDDVLRRLDELLELNVAVRTEIASALREIRRPDYPIVALQQLTRNAIMHRAYDSTNAPTRVYWYSDRIEIQSPGGLYGRVTAENIGTGATDYRNPLIAEIMHHLGFAQRFGMGIPLAQKALADNGNPPAELVFSPTHVVVILRPAP
jgi:ATP-dependent DNA helicase RecG